MNDQILVYFINILDLHWVLVAAVWDEDIIADKLELLVSCGVQVG